jgi:MFS family permease
MSARPAFEADSAGSLVRFLNRRSNALFATIIPVTEPVRLGLFFGAIYFLQGIGEPTEGLIAQPVRSLLKRWGHNASEITAFSSLLALPWSIKPLYGLLSDFVPIFGSRRRSYLILSGGVAAVCLLGLFARPVPPGALGTLLRWLIGPTVAVAFADVVADALMVERGQPLGLTGRLQAIQWGSLYAASILTGLVGGRLAEYRHETWSFLICGVGAIITLVLAWGCVTEPKRTAPAPRHRGREALATLGRVGRTPGILGIGAFLFLWSFNPFSNDILNIHMTRELRFSEEFYGRTVVWISLGAIAGSLAYGTVGRRFSLRVRTHAAIVLGIASTLAYLAVGGHQSAVVISLVVGFAWIIGVLIQFDLAAQVCPPEAAGTTFALLMAVANLGTLISTRLGGIWYESGAARWGYPVSFRLLVAFGALCTAGCWLVVPALPRALLRKEEPR